jgi:hypothetical protein
VAALVRADGDAVGVLLDGGVDDVLHRAVVPEVDDLGALGLQHAAHDVDAGVVAVEQAGRGDEAEKWQRARIVARKRPGISGYVRRVRPGAEAPARA